VDRIAHSQGPAKVEYYTHQRRKWKKILELGKMFNGTFGTFET
jgi:hypothetical protein